MSHDIDVWTYNVHHARATSSIARDVHRAVALGADAVCLQEMNGHRDAVEHLPRGWRVHRPARNSGEDIPILYDGPLRRLASGSRHVSDAAKVERAAGGGHVTDKTVTWVRFAHRPTGHQIVLMNTHAIPSIEAVGHPDPHHPRRAEVFAELMTVITQMVSRRTRDGYAVILCGDLNVDFRHDAAVQDPRFPYRVFDRVGLHASYRDLGSPAGGTHGDRLIDYVAYTPRPWLRVVHHQVHHDGFGSDHRPVSARFRIR